MHNEEARRILDKTSDGLTVFKHYLGDDCAKGLFCNPYRNDDERPSCKLYKCAATNGGDKRWHFHDFGDSSWHCDCFSFVAKICNLNIKLDFREILSIIDKELSLCALDENFKVIPDYKPMKKLQHVVAVKSKSNVIGFEPVYSPFTPELIGYWQGYSIIMADLQRYNIRNVRQCRFLRDDKTDFTVYGTASQPMFAYLFNQGTGAKFYRPFSDTRFFYAGNLPRPYIFGWEQLPCNGEQVFITGGEKDVLSLAAHGFSGISFNSETASVPEEIIHILSTRFQHIIFLYDSDATGKRESRQRVKQYKDKYKVYNMDLPLAGTKKEKDISDFFRLGKTAAELQLLVKETITK